MVAHGITNGGVPGMKRRWIYGPKDPRQFPVDKTRCRAEVWAENELFPRQCLRKPSEKHCRVPVCRLHKITLTKRANYKRSRNLPR